MGSTRRKFTPEFKDEAVELLVSSRRGHRAPPAHPGQPGRPSHTVVCPRRRSHHRGTTPPAPRASARSARSAAASSLRIAAPQLDDRVLRGHRIKQGFGIEHSDASLQRLRLSRGGFDVVEQPPRPIRIPQPVAH